MRRFLVEIYKRDAVDVDFEFQFIAALALILSCLTGLQLVVGPPVNPRQHLALLLGRVDFKRHLFLFDFFVSLLRVDCCLHFVADFICPH